jgi:hypothetical protein
MSDTEEVVIPRASKQTPTVKKITNPNPETARLKMKEKRERLKKEKEAFIIEEAKKQLAIQMEKKAQAEALAKEQEALAKKQEEEKRMADPTYMMMKKMEDMMAMFQKQSAPEPVKAKRAPKKKVVVEESEPEEKPIRKPRAPKPVADKPNKSPGLPKPKKKVVYLQEQRQESDSTQFVGYDVAPPAQPIQYQPSSGLLAAMMSRRNMNSVYQ